VVNFYPVHLNLAGKRVAVIGGGTVAERKVLGLFDTGATIEIISPEVTDTLREIIKANEWVNWKKKNFSASDLAEAILVFAATNNPEVNQEVKNSCQSWQFVNLSDAHADSDFIIPALVKRGRLSITVSTSGASPILSRKIRQQIEETYDERYIGYLDFLYTCRSYILKHVDDPAKKKQLLTAIVDPAFIESSTREEDFHDLYKGILES
jgi:precorrin-2 dehydrogenase / sirohydrochlorin ferrochelatase